MSVTKAVVLNVDDLYLEKHLAVSGDFFECFSSGKGEEHYWHSVEGTSNG